MNCPKCNRFIETIWSFCPYCGMENGSNFFIDSRDGERYRTVQIGNQIWMAENLRYQCDGSHPYKEKSEFIKKYGLLYSRSASRIVAPDGWHLPSYDEFKQLEQFVGDVNQLKKSGFWEKTWNDPYGFGALPAGYSAQGVHFGLGTYTSYWTSSGNDFYHQGSFFEIGRFNYDECGDVYPDSISIRLIKDT